jgi:hypothetical protein
MSYKEFCLRTSKGLSVGEFDNTESHRIFDSDFTCFLGLIIILLVLCFLLCCFQVFSSFRTFLEETKQKDQKIRVFGKYCTRGVLHSGRYRRSHDTSALNQEETATILWTSPFTHMEGAMEGWRAPPLNSTFPLKRSWRASWSLRAVEFLYK